nr:hypothetical protein [Nocardia tengchongensis]
MVEAKKAETRSRRIGNVVDSLK